MKLLALLLAALLLAFSAPRSGLNVISVPVLALFGERNLSGSIGAPTPEPEQPSASRAVEVHTQDLSEPVALNHLGAPLFARTGIGSAAGAIRGTARWFSTGPNGVAAAGPRLRAALGSHWRGTLVGVTYRGRTIWLRLGDWCACGSGSIIDLPDEVFARFAPLSRGVLSVTVHWGDRNTLPATSTEEGWKP